LLHEDRTALTLGMLIVFPIVAGSP
jgi:hypothetical protein